MRFEDIVTLENIYRAWMDFSRGKLAKQDVQIFAADIEEELLALQNDLSAGAYIHGGYSRFIVHDPKRRVIHKASVRDRVVHRLIYNFLLPLFNRRWLDCSFSCRPGFGQHRSINVMKKYLRQATSNWSKERWVLKCDVKKFFDSVDHKTLTSLLNRVVLDESMCGFLQNVISSFCVSQGRGLPIGNLTSQLFANVYLHELDRYVKHDLKQRYYLRYADDFVIIGNDVKDLKSICASIETFLGEALFLNLHPQKTSMRKSTWGIDWLGHVLLPDYQLIRPSTKRRMMRKAEAGTFATFASYHGLLEGSARRSVDQTLLQKFALRCANDTMSSVGS